ncbi:MAG: LamG domain-containing protein, partial [Pseudomonadota bacterium]
MDGIRLYNAVFSARRLDLASVLAASLFILGGCGGGAETTENPITAAPDVVAYSGPPPATDDVQSFRINIWDNLKAVNRCGGCHTAGGQSPAFVRQDDVNMAYAEATVLVDLGQPDESRLVTKVSGGHNCWLESDAACGDILTTWVSAWAGVALADGGREIELTAPVIRDVGTSRNFPADSGLYATTVYPVVDAYCAQCHDSAAATPQSPYFADADIDTAYSAAISKINLDQTDDSRLVLRLRNEFHNCWNGCTASANEMQAAIDAMAGSITPTEVDPALVTSKALTLYDGVVASGGNRFESNAIALYEFKTGEGTIAYDTSGIEPALNLNFSGDVEWVGGWGIDLKGGKAQGSTVSSAKLHSLISATGEYAIEAWVVPGNVTQEEARIVSYSAGTMARNFSLTQTLYSYDHFNRSGATDGNGEPALSTNADDEDLQATLQHVVANYDPVNGRRIYVNGVFTDDGDLDAGTLDDWDDTFAFVLGNEASSDRPWQGALRLVAVHNRVLTEEQILQNFEAGVGEKFFLLFSVAEHTG